MYIPGTSKQSGYKGILFVLSIPSSSSPGAFRRMPCADRMLLKSYGRAFCRRACGKKQKLVYTKSPKTAAITE